MSGDKKKSVAVIMSKLNGPAQPKGYADGGEVDNSIAIDSASEEIMQAIEKKDVKALTSALKSFMDMCYDEEQQESPEEESKESAEGES